MAETVEQLMDCVHQLVSAAARANLSPLSLQELCPMLSWELALRSLGDITHT